MRPTPRCGISAALVQPNQALLFGGVHDEEKDEEEGTFYNDLFALDLEKFQWFNGKYIINSLKSREGNNLRNTFRCV